MVALNTHDSRIDTSAVCVANEPSCPGLILPQRRNGVDPGSPPRGNPARDCGGSFFPRPCGPQPGGVEGLLAPGRNPPRERVGQWLPPGHGHPTNALTEKPPPT